VTCLKIIKLIIKVVAEAITRHVKALAILLDGLSLVTITSFGISLLLSKLSAMMLTLHYTKQ